MSLRHAVCRASRLAALALVGAAGAGWAQPVAYTLVPEYSFVHFEVLHFGTSTIRGRFGPLQGQVMLDRKAGSGDVSLRVPTAQVDTGIGVFNNRLRQADLLASADFPEAFFVASRMRFAGDQLAEVRGEFTWRGVSQPLSLRALRFGCRRDQQVSPAEEICGGDFEGEILRSEFGATFALPFVADRVRLVVQVEGRKRPP